MGQNIKIAKERAPNHCFTALSLKARMKLVILLSVISVAVCGRVRRGENCPYTLVGQSYMKVFDDKVDWETAKSNCEAKVLQLRGADGELHDVAGHLTHDQTEEAHEFLKSQSGTKDPAKQIWISGHSAAGDGVFTWLDGTLVPTPGHWDPQALKERETGTVKAGSDCMCIGWKTADNWDDQSCSNEQSYACQFDLPGIF